MNSRLFNYIRLIAFLLTLVALIGERYLPQKVLQVFPNTQNVLEVFSDEVNEGASRAVWVDEDNYHWRCELRDSDTYPMCGLSVTFSEIPFEYFDLSSYHTMKVSLSYKGPATKIRIYLRNHKSAYSTLYNIEAAKFQSTVLRISDFKPEVVVQLSEFSVADWWKDQYDIPREQSQPAFDALISIGIDQAAPLVFGDHDYKLNRIQFVGDWVSREVLYLGIIVTWMLLLAWEAAVRFSYLYGRTKRDSLRLRELRAESEKYKEMSTTDGLTQIPNRVGFQQSIDKIVSERGSLLGFSLLVLDIDYFKRINDLRGHQAGDRILRGFAGRILRSVKANDIVARWGGEEFVVLTALDPDEVLSFAEKLRTSIHVYVFEPDVPLKISVSIGGAVATKDDSYRDLFRRADECLYKAKSSGRNCVVFDEL